MAYVTGFVGLVALLQGVAWLGASRQRVVAGAVLAPVGLLVLAGSLVTVLVPGLWTR